MGLNHSSRVFDSMDKINKLQSRYVEASDEIATLKDRKRDIKNKLKEARSEYDAIKGMNLNKGERTMVKADKKATIDALEQLLEMARAEIRGLEKDKDRAFERRERIKARVVRQMSFDDERSSSSSKSRAGPVVVMNKVGDVAAVAKMMDLMRIAPAPSCMIGSEVRDDSAIKEAALKLKVKISDDEDHRPEIMEKKIINTGNRRIAQIRMR